MKKTIRIIGDILSWLVVVVTLAFMIFTIWAVRTQGANRSVFGVRLLVALSNSMSATDFSAGDLIFIREVDPATLQVGDIISYISTDKDSYGSIITHKIRTIDQGTGGISFRTYGTTTGTDDEVPTYSQNIQGKYIGRIPKIGLIIQTLKNHPVYIVVLVFAILAIYILCGIFGTWAKKRNQQQARGNEQIYVQIESETSNKIPGEQTETSGNRPQGGVQTEDEE